MENKETTKNTTRKLTDLEMEVRRTLLTKMAMTHGEAKVTEWMNDETTCRWVNAMAAHRAARMLA